ncbi:MAG: hypothetical protein K8R69_04465, partial [Deltaproteobacteria bacterium]|nr:hypothetical protein [Deltaproteobacteria bacterium]
KESFLRDVAPIFLLTCDVSGVGRGMKSPSCAFLANHKDLLKVGIQNNGWSCGAVTSWDFKNGRLASFPIAATNGAQNCETADALALVDSFSSTVTNFGDCGTANRLYACPKMIGGKLAYPNLCHLCEVPANALDPTQFGEDLDAMGPTLGSVSQLCGQFGPQSPPGVGGAASHPIPPSIGCEITHESQQVCGSTPTNAGSQLSNALAGAPTGNDCPPGNGFQAPGGGRPIVNPGIGGLDSNTLRAKWAGKVFSQSEKALGHAVEPLAKEVFEEVLESSVKYSFKLSEVLPYVSGGLVRVGFLVGILTGTAFTTISLVFEPSSIASEGDASNIYPPWQGPPTQEMINQGTWQTNPGGSRDPSFERDLTSTRNGSNKSTGTVTVGIAGDANGDGKIDENEMKTDTDGDGTSDWEDPDPQDPKIKTDSDLPQNNSGSGKDDATAGDSPDEFSVSECTWYGKAMKSVGYCLNAQLSQAASALGMPQKSLPAGPTSPKDPVSNFPTDSDHGISAGGPDICYLSVGPTAPAGVQATAGSGGLTNPTGPGQYKPGTGQALPTKGGTVCTSTEPCPGGGKRTAPSCECPQQPVGSNGTVPLGTGGGLPTGGGGTPLAK